MSRPIVVIVCIFSSSNGGSLYSTHICGTHVPVKEPSTASIAEVQPASGTKMCLLGRWDKITMLFT
jgi:hypothetical protein